VRPERLLVTGSSGLIGRALLPWLQEAQFEVDEVSRGAVESSHSSGVDLTDAVAASAVVDRVSPTTIIHLAGGHGTTVEALRAANVATAVNVIGAAARLKSRPRVILFGSSAEYGEPPAGLVTESSPTEPVTPYGRVKLEATAEAQRLAATAGIPMFLIRPFNIVSPDVPPASALGNIRRQLASGTERRRTVRCGRLDVVRDFVPIEAVVATVLRLLGRDDWPPILNVCSGNPVLLQELLAAMAHAIGVEPQVVPDPDLVAIPAANRLVGDPTRLRELGVVYQPTVMQLGQLMMGPGARALSPSRPRG
jgi:nucleoside-diphosphate-sugar epimerase